MATITTEVARAVGPDGQLCIVQVDYDDVSLDLLLVRIINNQANLVEVMATVLSNGRTFSGTFDTGTNSVALPQGANNRLRSVRIYKGQLDGVSISFRDPA